MTKVVTSAKTISIVIVDDHQMLTDALALVIENEADLRVIGVAVSCAATRELLAHTCPDVLLLDVSLPDGDGLGLVPDIKGLCPKVHILVLTSLADERTLLRAIDTGVSGFLGKHRPLAEVMVGIRQAAEGEIVMPTSLLLGLLSRTTRDRGTYLAQQGHEPLTVREREILARLAQGKSSAAIAAELHIAPLTVRTHIRNLLDKLDAHSRLEAVASALRRGLIEPPI